MTLIRRLTFLLALSASMIPASASPSDSLECSALGLSRDGKYVVATVRNPATRDIRLYGWSTETGKLLYSAVTGLNYVWNLAMSPSNNIVTVAGENGIVVRDYTTGAIIGQVPVGLVSEMTFSPSGRYLVAKHAENIKMFVIDTRKWEILHTLMGRLGTVTFNEDETLLEARAYYDDIQGRYAKPPMLRSVIYEMSTGRFIKARHFQSNPIDSIKGYSAYDRDSTSLKGKALFETAVRETDPYGLCDCKTSYLTYFHPYVIRWNTKKFSQAVIKNFNAEEAGYLLYMDCNSIFTTTYENDAVSVTRYDISKGGSASRAGSYKVDKDVYVENIGIFEISRVSSGLAAFIIHDETGQYLQSINVYKLQPESGEYPGPKVASYRIDW